MAIEYIEIRSADTREIIGIIDGAQSVIWHSVYYGCGDFEIYIAATAKNVELLQVGNYASKPFSDELGIIERVEITNTVTDGKMIVASGRLAKSILDRRHIYNISGHTNEPTILSGKVETAVRTVVQNNAISCLFDSRRNISILELGELGNYPEIIVDDDGNATQKQVSYQNLLTYTDSVLEEYGLSSKIIIDEDTSKLQFIVYKGENRSADNTDGNDPVIFSIEFDNLIEDNYVFDLASWKNAALIGGEGEGLERFYSLIAGTETGLERRETFIDASSISKSHDQDQTYTDALYNQMLISDGLQKLAALIPLEDFQGQLNVTGGVWKLGEHYNLGDIVTVQDNELGFYINVRITEITETQDESGYGVDVTYSAERTD